MGTDLEKSSIPAIVTLKSVIMDYGLEFHKQWFEVKHILRMDSHSDGTHSLQRIHWWWDVMKLFKICSNEKQTYLHLGWPEGEDIFNKYSFLGELFFSFI